jgi:hypothetical protein
MTMEDTQPRVERVPSNGSGGFDGNGGAAEQEAAGTLSPAAALVDAVGELSEFSFQPAFEGEQPADHYEMDDYEGVRRGLQELGRLRGRQVFSCACAPRRRTVPPECCCRIV